MASCRSSWKTRENPEGRSNLYRYQSPTAMAKSPKNQ